MKFKVFYKSKNRYLSEYELEENVIYTNLISESDQYGGCLVEGEYDFSFRVNLATGKIQTNIDNSCTDLDCCTGCEMWCDDDDFVIEVCR